MRSRYARQCASCPLGLDRSLLFGIVEGAGSANRRQDLGQVVASTLLDRTTHAGCLLGVPILQHEDQRQGRLALGQIVTQMLAGLEFDARLVRPVVDQLKSRPEMYPVGRHRLLGRCTRATE